MKLLVFLAEPMSLHPNFSRLHWAVKVVLPWSYVGLHHSERHLKADVQSGEVILLAGFPSCRPRRSMSLHHSVYRLIPLTHWYAHPMVPQPWMSNPKQQIAVYLSEISCCRSIAPAFERVSYPAHLRMCPRISRISFGSNCCSNRLHRNPYCLHLNSPS